MSELEQLLESLRDELAEINSGAYHKLEVDAHARSPQCTCGVCGEENSFSGTYIVDPDKFEYDDWDTQALDERNQPMDDERICVFCVGKLLSNGYIVPWRDA